MVTSPGSESDYITKTNFLQFPVSAHEASGTGRKGDLGALPISEMGIYMVE